MQLFRTPVTPAAHKGWLSHSDSILMVGSCFSDNIGRRLGESLFDVEVNPLGALYNPLSIEACVELIMSGREVEESELFYHRGVWRHFMCHTSLAHPDRKAAAETINARLREARNLIGRGREGSLILAVTLGSTYAYIHNGEVVANCHTLPAGEFERRRLSVEESFGAIMRAARRIAREVPSLKLLVTVSPVRHLDEGLEGNSLGKATLRLAADRVVSETVNALYFPAFEIMNDDLRDYRFYAADMRHPSDVAVEYIYELFAQSLMSANTIALAGDCRKLLRRASHRPLNGALGDRSRQSDLEAMAATIAKIHAPLPPRLSALISKLLSHKDDGDSVAPLN